MLEVHFVALSASIAAVAVVVGHRMGSWVLGISVLECQWIVLKIVCSPEQCAKPID